MFCFGSNEKLVPKPAVCVRDRSLPVETSGSIHDSPTAVPERPIRNIGMVISN